VSAFSPGLVHFLIIGVVLFAFGTYTVVTRTNAVGILMGVELILNAANVNFVAFNRFSPSPQLTGQVFSLFVIVLAAAEAAVALAIVLAIYMNTKTIDVTQADTLKD
jgi:NADH-quinone oxidoreductase subunit K